MSQTSRLEFNGTSPSTRYYAGADIVAQSQSGNYSVVRISAHCFNTGDTSSNSGNVGYHTVQIDGLGYVERSGTLESGYPNGALRWDVSKDIIVPHNADGTKGNVTLRLSVSGWHPTNEQTFAFGGFPRIPKKPSAPGKPVASEILPNSLRLTWTASTDNGGSSVDGYLVRRWDNPEGSGSYTDSYANNLTRVLTGLVPGKEYRFVVIAHNNSYDQWSPGSTAIVVRTLSGVWTKVSGVWRRVALFVKVNGVWKSATLFGKKTGAWKISG